MFYLIKKKLDIENENFYQPTPSQSRNFEQRLYFSACTSIKDRAPNKMKSDHSHTTIQPPFPSYDLLATEDAKILAVVVSHAYDEHAVPYADDVIDINGVHELNFIERKWAFEIRGHDTPKGSLDQVRQTQRR